MEYRYWLMACWHHYLDILNTLLALYQRNPLVTWRSYQINILVATVLRDYDPDMKVEAAHGPNWQHFSPKPTVQLLLNFPDNKVHRANMGPTWVLSAPDGPHVGPMNLAIRVSNLWVPIFNMLSSIMRIYSQLEICHAAAKTYTTCLINKEGISKNIFSGFFYEK